MSEFFLWEHLRGVLPPEGDYSRIESRTSSGAPDVNYCIRGYEGWIELKDQTSLKPRIPFARKGLLQSQEDWIFDRLSSGGRVSVIARVRTEVFLLQGWTTLDLNYLNINDLMQYSVFCYTMGSNLSSRIADYLCHAYTPGKKGRKNETRNAYIF